MADVFARWNEGKLRSYLIEITANILRHKDKTGGYLIDKILDAKNRFGSVFCINFNIIFQSFDIHNFLQVYLYQFVVTFYKNAVYFFRFLNQFEPLKCLIGSLQEIDIRNRFQQIIERIDTVAVNGILTEGGGKHNTGTRIHHFRKLQSVKLRHLNIQEKKIDFLIRQLFHGLNRTGIFPG